MPQDETIYVDRNKLYTSKEENYKADETGVSPKNLNCGILGVVAKGLGMPADGLVIRD